LSALTDFLRKRTDTDSPEDRPGFTGPPKSAKLAAELRDKPALGGLEILGSIGSSMAGQAVGGLRGLATLATGGGLDKAVDDIKGTEEALTYEPKSEGGKAGLAAIGKVIEPVNEYVRAHVADPIGEVSPAAGAAVLASSAILPGPKGLKGAAGGVRKAAKAGRAAGEAEVAGGAAERAVEAPTPPMHEPSAGERAAEATQQHQPPPEAPLPGSTIDLQQQRAEALRAPPAAPPDPVTAALRAVRNAEEANIRPLSGINEQFNRALQAARDAHREGGDVFEAANTAIGVGPHRPKLDAAGDVPMMMRLREARRNADAQAPATPPLDPGTVAMRALSDLAPGDLTPNEIITTHDRALRAATRAIDGGADFEQALAAARTELQPREAASQPGTLSPEHEARLRKVDSGNYLAATHVSNPEALAARARVLARRLLDSGNGVNEHSTEFLNIVDKLRHRMEVNSRGSRIVDDHGGTDWTPEPEQRQPLRLAGVDYSHLDAARSALRADALRNQKSLLPNVDPGWEHQTLIPGLSPLSQREGALMAARRLGIKTRELRRGDPSMNRAAVEAFFEGGRDNPEMFQYGVDPVRTGELSKHASLEDFADVYNSRTNADINIHREGGEPDYDSIDVDVEPEAMYHGRGEPYRDESGEYVMKKKKHEAGDKPVYDERGNVKKEVIGFNEDEGPKKQKYVAVGGEPMREGGRYGGSVKYRYAKTTRSNRTPMRDESGDIKYDADHDPDAYQQRYEDALDDARSNAESETEVARMRAQGGGAIDVTYPQGDDASVYAGSNKGKFGSLLYQTLLNHASHSGYQIGGGGLTDINALRILSNANSNYARTGKNPRGLSGTNSGDLPPYRQGAYRAHEEYAKGPEIWRSESDEALKRAQGRGGAPERMAFDPELGFTLDGAPASPDQLKAAFESMSPGVKHTGVGMKTLMRSAVFDWVRDATPEQAAQVAKAWGKKHGPLFGVAGAGLTVQQALREKADEGTQ